MSGEGKRCDAARPSNRALPRLYSARELAATNNVYLLDAVAIATATGGLPN